MRARARFGALAPLACVLTIFLPAGAGAQEECPGTLQRGPLEVTPLSGPFPVTLGAYVRVRYSEGYFDDPAIGARPEDVFSLWESETGTPVAGRASVIGDTLVFVPDAPFAPSTLYEGLADGVDTSLALRFTTGSSFDAGPPVFSGRLSMTASEIEPSCDAPDGGYRVDVTFAPAIDDGPPGDIEYLLYLSRGPEVEAPQLRSRARNLAASEIVMAFVLDPAEAVSPICVTVHAVDGAGNLDDDGPPLCDDPIKGNFFAPLCAAAGPVGAAGSVSPLAGLALLCVAGLAWRRRRWAARARAAGALQPGPRFARGACGTEQVDSP